MPTPTYTPLANITLGSSASSVTFSNIPNTYRDLILVMNAQNNQSGYDNVYMTFNGDTGSTRSSVYALGNGSSTISGTTSAFYAGTINPTTNTVSTCQILDYSATDKHTTGLTRGNAATSEYGNGMYASRWASTSAVTSFVLTPQSSSFDSGSTFALYGIAG
jgi:hypothetical protein